MKELYTKAIFSKPDKEAIIRGGYVSSIHFTAKAYLMRLDYLEKYSNKNKKLLKNLYLEKLEELAMIAESEYEPVKEVRNNFNIYRKFI